MSVSAPAGAGVVSARLPPSDEASIARLFDTKLAPLGFRVRRAGLETEQGYEQDPTGRHLAVYVEPIDSLAAAEYVERFPDIAAVFLPAVFKKWKGLHSFDVCTEPEQAPGDTSIPLSVTQLAVTRAGASGVRWRRSTLVDLLVTERRLEAQSGPASKGFYVYFNAEAQGQSAYTDALEEAERRAP